MNIKILLLTTMVALFASAALAQGIRDAGSKVRGEYGTSQPTITRQAPMYRAPTAVAQSPTDRRSFSYNPAQPATGGCTAKTPSTMAQVPADSQVRRSFSYEPAMGDNRVYRGPAMRGYSSGMRDAGSKVRGEY